MCVCVRVLFLVRSKLETHSPFLCSAVHSIRHFSHLLLSAVLFAGIAGDRKVCFTHELNKFSCTRANELYTIECVELNADGIWQKFNLMCRVVEKQPPPPQQQQQQQHHFDRVYSGNNT